MDFKYKQLEQELTALGKVFSELGARLAEVAREVTAPGLMPSEKLLEQISASRTSFENARSAVHGHASAMLVSPLPKLGELVSIATIDSLLKASAVAEETKFSIEGERERVLAILGRVLSITHRESGEFKPLQECHAKIGELRDAVSNVAWPHRHPESEQIVASKHPTTALLHFVENLDKLDDDSWMMLETTITDSYGKPLFVAASRGKLEVKAETKPVAAAPAAPVKSPEPAKPPVAAEKPAEKKIVVEKAPEKPVAAPEAAAAPVAAAPEKKPAPPVVTAPVPPAPPVVAEKPQSKPVAPAQPVVAPVAAAPVAAAPPVNPEKKPAIQAVAPVVAAPAASAPVAPPVPAAPVVAAPVAVTAAAPSPVPPVAAAAPPRPPVPAAVAVPAPPVAAHVPVATHPIPAAPAPVASATPAPAAPAAAHTAPTGSPLSLAMNSLTALATATEPVEKKPVSATPEPVDKQRKEPRLAAPASAAVSKPEPPKAQQPDIPEPAQQGLAGDGSQRPQRWGFWRGNR